MTRQSFLKLLGCMVTAGSIDWKFLPIITPKWECPFCKNPELLNPTGRCESYDELCIFLARKLSLEIDHEMLHKLMENPITASV